MCKNCKHFDKMKKPKLLYLMHIPWGWIKQRPHFFAEKLSQYFDIRVYGREGLRGRSHSKHNKNHIISYKPFYNSGYISANAWKSKVLDWIYQLWFSHQVKNITKYQYIWITNIWIYQFIKSKIKDNQFLIFDCMDDAFEFPYTKERPDIIEFYHEIEQNLVKRADLLIFSAKYLSETVYRRSPYNKSKKIIVNNAIEFPEPNALEFIPEEITNKLHLLDSSRPCLLYIGTIAPWFDFDIFQNVFKTYPDLSLVLIGPTEIPIPKSKNIKYLGSIERKYIFLFMEKADALCMPFHITELIRSVNPVKLYEYLYSGKPVIAPLYEESEQFKEYIYLYDNANSFLNLCKDVYLKKLKPKVSIERSRKFIKDNTWDIRIEKIKKSIMDKRS